MVMANAPTPSSVLAFGGDDDMAVERVTSGAHPASQRQQRRAQAVRARETRANLIGSWVRAEEDAEAALQWTQRTLQDHAARDAMTASLDLWMWPSHGQDGEGNPDGGHSIHETMFDPVARRGQHAAGSAGGHDHDEIAILGESGARSQSPYDAAVHTMPEDDVPSSRQGRGEPALGGGVGVGAWAPQDGGTRVRSVPALEGADDEDVDTGGRGDIEGGSDTGRDWAQGPAVELDRQAGSGPSVPIVRAEPKPGRPRRSKGGARRWRSV